MSNGLIVICLRPQNCLPCFATVKLLHVPRTLTNEGGGDGGLAESCINRAGEWEGADGASGGGGQTEERRYGEDKACMLLPHEGGKDGTAVQLVSNAFSPFLSQA